MATSFVPKSPKKEQTFLYFDPLLQAWDSQVYTQAELAELPDICAESLVCTADGQNQMTYGELLSKPVIKECYQYEVVMHGKYYKDVFDADGLKAKLNAMGAHGYRLVGFGMVSGNAIYCDKTHETMKQTIVNGVLGIDNDNTVTNATQIKDYRVAVAVMEKKC